MIIAVDGNNLAHRCFHTKQGVLTTKQGKPSGVILGVLNALKGYLEKFPETTRMIVCFDGGRSKWRKELYPEYKAQRSYNDDPEKKAKYEGLWAQLRELEDILPMVGVDSIKVDGQEADDLIAGICRFYADDEDHVMIITSDKDMYQLVGENVSLYSPHRDTVISPLNFYEEVGVSVEGYVGYRALMGDTSDNIAGIPGIGPKTAMNIINKYGHIDKALNEGREQLMKSKRTQKIFEPASLEILGINNKLMNFSYAKYDEMAEAFTELLENPAMYDARGFREKLMEWQFVSILSNFLPWIHPFTNLGED